MKKWEYQDFATKRLGAFGPKETVMDVLDRIGSDGWEAFDIQYFPSIDGAIIYAKREVPS